MSLSLVFEQTIESVNNKCPSNHVSFNCRKFYGIVKRRIEFTCSCTDNGQVYLAKRFMDDVDGHTRFFQFSDVYRYNLRVDRILLAQLF